MAANLTNITFANVPNFSISEDNKFPKSKRKLQKHLRSSGLAYVSRTGKLIPAKKVADELCQCPHKCDDLVPTEARQRLFQHFYGLGEADAQNQFLRQNMDLRARLNVPETPSANGRPPRRITCKYLVPLMDEERSVEVCQKAFVSAFVITTKRVRLQREKLISSLGLSSYKSHNRSKDKDKQKIQVETNNNIITLATLAEEMSKANNNNNNTKTANNNIVTTTNNRKNGYSLIRNFPDTININSVTITRQPKPRQPTTQNNNRNNQNKTPITQQPKPTNSQMPVQEAPLNLSANVPMNLNSNLSLILQSVNKAPAEKRAVKQEQFEVTAKDEFAEERNRWNLQNVDNVIKGSEVTVTKEKPLADRQEDFDVTVKDEFEKERNLWNLQNVNNVNKATATEQKAVKQETPDMTMKAEFVEGQWSPRRTEEGLLFLQRQKGVKRETPEVIVKAEFVGGEWSPQRTEEGSSTVPSTDAKPPPKKRSRKSQLGPYMHYSMLIPEGVAITPVVNPDFDRDLMIVNNFFHNQLWKPEYIGAHS